MNIWLNVLVGVGTVVGFFISVLVLTSTVTQRFTEVSGKVDAVSTKVDSASTLGQQKVDALSDTVKSNQAEQQTFRANVQNWLTKLSESQQSLSAQINQERVDRLTEAAKKK